MADRDGPESTPEVPTITDSGRGNKKETAKERGGRRKQKRGKVK